MGPLTSVDSVFIRSQLGHSLGEKIELERKWRIKQPTWKYVPLKPANLFEWDQTPVIGKVTGIYNDHVTIHHWKGPYESSWKPVYFRTNRRNSVETRSQDLPKEVILLSSYTLA